MQVHQSDEIDRKPRKTVQDWTSDSAFEAEYTPPGFEQHSSNPDYTSADHDDPDLPIHTQDEYFDDDGDPALTP